MLQLLEKNIDLFKRMELTQLGFRKVAGALNVRAAVTLQVTNTFQRRYEAYAAIIDLWFADLVNINILLDILNQIKTVHYCNYPILVWNLLA